MQKVILILPSPINQSETFIKELVIKLERDCNFRYLFIYLSPKFTFSKFICFLKSFFYSNRLIQFFKTSKETHVLKKLYQIYINIEVLTTSNVKVVHYLFSNLAVGREKLAGIIGAKNSIGLRGYDISFFEINHPGSYSSLFWESVDSIQANSNDLYIWALKWGANKKIPIKIINAAVNDDFILDSSLVKKRQNFDRINLIFVGRLHWKKGLDTLFRIFLNLLKTKNVFLDIVGDGPEMEKIKFLIEKLNLYDRVFIRGKLSQNDILKCFDDSDILLAPSIQEGCSNVVLEAQARGLYCIVSNAEGMNEVVEVNKTGVICDMWDDKKWVEEVIAYSNFDYKDRLKISEYSISRISKYFTRSSQVKQWNSYFNGLCSNL